MDFKNNEIVKKTFNKKNKALVEKNENSGITLIILIVSIIVLFIIAGVAIVMLMKINNSSFDEAIDLPDYDKYRISYYPLSMIESSTDYEFYIDLKNKEITEIETYYWIDRKTGESKNVKKIDDATNNKLIEKIKEIERNDINKDNEEMYNFKNDKYKNIIINEDKDIDSDILQILLEEIF